jgi:hypothetical protein
MSGNVFQLLANSQSLIHFMGYFQARYDDRIELFVDVMYRRDAPPIRTAAAALRRLR